MDISNLFNPGLYKITCLKNNKVYIGESANVLNRLGRHANDLEKNRHDCFELQNDFNRYGKKWFKFENLDLNLNFYERKKEEKKMIQKQKKSYNKKSTSTWNFYSQKIQIENQTYVSLRQASLQTGKSRTHLTRKCKDPQCKDYFFLEKTNYDSIYKKKSICVIIHGVFYDSISKASKALKKSPTTIKKRCEAKKYPNYEICSEKSEKV